MLVYSFVARGNNVLADYTSYTGNFATVAIQCLDKLSYDKVRIFASGFTPYWERSPLLRVEAKIGFMHICRGTTRLHSTATTTPSTILLMEDTVSPALCSRIQILQPLA